MQNKKSPEQIIKWCLNQKDGIKLVQPNETLSNAYRKEADETLEAMLTTKGKWKIIMAYYSCYNALYSILIKSGVKCEIHSCSIALMKLIGFGEDHIKFMQGLKEDRIGVQYYLKDKHLEDENEVKNFLLKCKELGNGMDIQKLREKLMLMQDDKK